MTLQMQMTESRKKVKDLEGRLTTTNDKLIKAEERLHKVGSTVVIWYLCIRYLMELPPHAAIELSMVLWYIQNHDIECASLDEFVCLHQQL